MRQKQVKKGPDESGPAAGDQKGYVHHDKVHKLLNRSISMPWVCCFYFLLCFLSCIAYGSRKIFTISNCTQMNPCVSSLENKVSPA